MPQRANAGAPTRKMTATLEGVHVVPRSSMDEAPSQPLESRSVESTDVWGTASILVESPLLNVYDVRCRAPQSGYGPIRSGNVAQIILPRRGAFVVAVQGSEPLLIDTSMALVFGDREKYRVSHPGTDGDDCTVFVLPFDVHEEAVGEVRGRIGPIEPRVHLAVCLITRALYGCTPEQPEAEEAALLLVAALVRAFADSKPQGAESTGRSQRVRVEQVRALLAGSPTARWNLDRIARTVNCSPFHLARQFRAVTGETISRYLLRLRLDLALERIAGGEQNLSAVAFDTGFAHHSHLSARFHASFGITPSEARDALTKPRLEKLRLLIGAEESQRLRRVSFDGTAALLFVIGLIASALIGAIPARAADRSERDSASSPWNALAWRASPWPSSRPARTTAPSGFFASVYSAAEGVAAGVLPCSPVTCGSASAAAPFASARRLGSSRMKALLAAKVQSDRRANTPRCSRPRKK